MIEKMKKVTLVCLASERQSAVTALQKLGTVHILPTVAPQSEELQELDRQLENLNRVINYFSDLRLKKTDWEKQAGFSPEKALQDACAALQQLKANDDRLAVLEPAIERLTPWGEFSPEVLERLQAAGWHYALCSNSSGQLPELPENCYCQLVQQSKNGCHFLVLSQDSLAELDLPEEKFSHGRDLGALRREQQALLAQQQLLRQQLANLAGAHSPDFLNYQQQLERRKAFAQARDGMGLSGQELAYMHGYVPSAKLDELRASAYRHGWAIRHEDADPEDLEVPTKLNIPKRFRMAQLILDFIGILPGYNEVDVSVSLLLFLSLFCGMLVGDAGYGLLFCLLGLYLYRRTAARHGNLEPIKLLLLLSSCILVYGMLSGNWFGLPSHRLPLFFRGIPWLRDDVDAANAKLLCFFIGAFHLSLARIWAAIISANLRQAIGNVGWAIFLWANFFTVKMLLISGGTLGPVVKGMYIFSTVLILVCAVNWRDFGDIIYTPFNFINSLVDVLSYIRLYAVGLSSFCIAESFNAMSMQVWHSSPWLIPVGILVIFCGHCLNVALAGMGVLVHGIRLNTLEFSGHIGLEWGGKPYQPLAE
ncbi:MAG: hypothetical protein GX902_08635 [Lentisphaerae bacterium]|nr:hypothetical protein [Lentisphaerota bacterium]